MLINCTIHSLCVRLRVRPPIALIIARAVWEPDIVWMVSNPHPNTVGGSVGSPSPLPKLCRTAPSSLPPVGIGCPGLARAGVLGCGGGQLLTLYGQAFGKLQRDFLVRFSGGVGGKPICRTLGQGGADVRVYSIQASL